MNRAASTVEEESFSFELPPPRSVELTLSDRREKSRQTLGVQARVCPDGDEPLDVHTVDLSSHGLAITSARPLNVEHECNVELGVSVPELARPPALRASVRYCARLRDDQFRIGMKFTAVSIEAAELIVAALGL
jgi:PilZ domain